MIFFTIVMMITLSVADDAGSVCCNEKNLTVSGCAVIEVMVVGYDRTFARRSDGVTFQVGMSMMNMVPRYSWTWGTRIERDFHDTFRCNACILTRFAMILDSEDLIFVRNRNASGNFLLLEVRNDRWENGWPDFLPECHLKTPLVVRRLLNCDNTTHNGTYFLHHVGTFYTRSRGARSGPRNSTLVGYYRRHGDDGSDGWRTRVIAWYDDGETMADDEYLDRSGTVSLSGWREKDGKEVVISVNSFGHMCFFSRSYDSKDFVPPGKGDKFMPECLPANMLLGCPQSYCYTGFVDEIVSAENHQAGQGSIVKFVRGMYWVTDYPDLVSARIFRLNRKSQLIRSMFESLGGWTIAAIIRWGKTYV